MSSAARSPADNDDEDKQPPQELGAGGDEADERAGKGETVGHKRT